VDIMGTVISEALKRREIYKKEGKD